MTGDDDDDCHKHDEPTVIIVGAGIAGLAAAYRLCRSPAPDNNHNKQPQFHVTIVEAADRIGGRVWPYRHDNGSSSSSTAIGIDLGGQWLHEGGRRNPIRNVLKELGLRLKRYPPGFDKRTNYNAVTGQPLDAKLLRRARKLCQTHLKECIRQYQSSSVGINKDTSQQELVNELLQTLRDNENTADSSSSTSSSLLRQYIRYSLYTTECYEGCSLRDMSVLLDDIYQEFSGDDEMIEGGYEALLDKLMDTIQPHTTLLLNSVVETIQYNNNNNNNSSSGGVQVRLQNGDTIHGDYCVCTVSIGVLQQRRVGFVPDLPVSRWEAVDSIGMGTLNKVLLVFASVFWHQQECFGTMHPTDPTQHKLFFDGSVEYNGQPALLVLLASDASYRVDPKSTMTTSSSTTTLHHDDDDNKHSDCGGSTDNCPSSSSTPASAAAVETGMTDSAIVNECLGTLQTVFGKDTVTELRYSKVTRWNSNPLTCGAYSFTKVGCAEEAYDEIERPLGRLRFAGEATSKTNHATVHGAWMTGEREAERLFQDEKERQTSR